MQTPVPLPSYSFYKGMGAEWCAHPLPLHGLPFAHYPEGGVSTTPCVVPHARPLRAPPFGRHPAHAVPHAGQRARGTRQVGRTGVVHAERHAGSCSHAMGEGRRREAAPSSCYLGLCAAPLRRMGEGKRVKGGVTPRGAFAWHPRTQKEGGASATLHPSSRPLPSSSVCAPLPVHARMWAPPSLHPIRAAGRGRDGARTKQGPLLCARPDRK